ncbi:L-ectoine synthase [Siminovitchia terrae]|uniref:L-ectoine synthase n=1 Tax=Siminovitchia terrae TaxID=1914933 RepID=A0A429X428_SIMTE|nr:ectoine synthase [Siminovitchia terrae]RST58110.1 ectoine synthase [Siminovitchia terrae]GIN91542.1 L-ectoine synthase [Siminovitchia terrae]GIN95632.1 L-ectoine synthase [Siminovitchia terrae]
MIVRTLEEVIGTDNEVKADNWVSRRLLLKDDNMGFSYHDTIIYAGTETHIWYKNHLEAVYCVGGEGEIETISDGKVYPIKDGTMYALDKNDEHYLRATKDMRMICVFNPPLTGRETHDKDGVYPLVED